MHPDILTLVLAVIAVALIARLWTLFGTRNEDEPQRPNPFIPPPPKPQDDPIIKKIQGMIEPPPASLAGGLAQVKSVDPAFDEKQFLQEARASFTAIVEAYAGGDLDRVAGLLAPDLLAHFRRAADARKATGQTAQTRIAAIREAECVAATVTDGAPFITAQFVSSQENILRDAEGRIIGGEQGKVEDITDRWIFTRAPKNPDAKWIVTRTGA